MVLSTLHVTHINISKRLNIQDETEVAIRVSNTIPHHYVMIFQLFQTLNVHGVVLSTLHVTHINISKRLNIQDETEVAICVSNTIPNNYVLISPQLFHTTVLYLSVMF